MVQLEAAIKLKSVEKNFAMINDYFVEANFT